MELPELAAPEAIARATAGTPLIDVREQDEWDAGHAPQATFIPMSQLQERLAELPEEPFLVVCHSGGRSARVTAFLNREGFEAVNVDGGMLAWAQAGGPVVVEGPAAPTL